MPTTPSAFAMVLTTIGMAVVGAIFVLGLFVLVLVVWRLLPK